MENKIAVWRTRGCITKLALALVASLLALAASEFGFRVLKRARYRAVIAEWDHELYAMRPEEPFLYVLHPDRQRSSEIVQTKSHWNYTINSLGLRGPELRAEGGPRLLVLGDSYTFGWGVDDDEAFPRVLETRLNATPRSAPIEVVNCGTPGFNTVQQAAFLRHIWDRLDPDIVVLGFVMNDAEPPRVVPCPPDILYGFAPIWLLEDAKRAWNARVAGGATLASRLYERRPYLEQFAQGQPEREQCRAALAQIAATCRAQGVPLVLAILPAFDAEQGEGYIYAPIHERVAAWGQELGARTIDLRHAFDGVVRREFIVAGDGHPNGRAHERFAREIAPVVLEVLEH